MYFNSGCIFGEIQRNQMNGSNIIGQNVTFWPFWGKLAIFKHVGNGQNLRLVVGAVSESVSQ